MQKTKKIITIKLSSGRILYVDNDTVFDWSGTASRAVDFSSYTDEQLKEYIDKIDNFGFVRDNESFDFIIQTIKIDIEEELYTPAETLIKTALNRLSTREIEALGLEDISLYHNMKESHKQFQNSGDDKCAYSSNFETKSSMNQFKSIDEEMSSLFNSEISNINNELLYDEEPCNDSDYYDVNEEGYSISKDEETINTFIKYEVQAFNEGSE